MKIITWAIIATLAATTLTGCCSCRKQQKSQQPLRGTMWQLVEMNGTPVNAEAGQYTLLLSSSGDMSGSGDCNRLMGHYTAGEERSLTISQVASTRVLCPRGSREGEYIAMLGATTHYEMDGRMLILLSDGEQRAVFEAKAAVMTERR